MSEDNELFELCEEVYKRTKWVLGNNADIYDYPHQLDKNERWISPIYDTDYLLEKLPLVSVEKSNNEWIAMSGRGTNGSTYGYIADTPLLALLKLTIALSEAGELK